jgi:hypothetical protein
MYIIAFPLSLLSQSDGLGGGGGEEWHDVRGVGLNSQFSIHLSHPISSACPSRPPASFSTK